MSSSHIRPRIRKANAKVTTKTTPTKPSSSSSIPDESVDALARKMGSWMGLSSSDDTGTDTKSQEETINAPTAVASPSTPSPAPEPSEPTKPIQDTTANKKPVGILKKPKYSSSGTVTSSQIPVEQDEEEESTDQQKKASTPVVCEQFVMERDPFQKPMRKKNRPKPKETNHDSIEGYQPAAATLPAVKFAPSDNANSKTQNTETKDNAKPQQQSQPNNDSSTDTSEEPQIILSSFEELFEAAGNELPADRTKITPDTQLVEADLSFSVMTQEQYGEKMTEMKRELAQEQEDMYQMFMGNDNVFDDENSGGEGSDDDDDSEGEEEFLNFLMEQQMDADGDDYYQDDDRDDENNAAHESSTPRAFSLIWGALSRWWTPEAVEWMRRLEQQSSSTDAPLYGNNWSPQVDRSDIGASRCAGLMAMVKMYLPSSMRELGHAPDLQRTAESRIADWLRTFDYSAEAPKLPVNMWKAISCILLDMVLIESRSETVDKLPPSVIAVNMTMDEYKYLTRSAVRAFQPWIMELVDNIEM